MVLTGADTVLISHNEEFSDITKLLHEDEWVSDKTNQSIYRKVLIRFLLNRIERRPTFTDKQSIYHARDPPSYPSHCDIWSSDKQTSF